MSNIINELSQTCTQKDHEGLQIIAICCSDLCNTNRLLCQRCIIKCLHKQKHNAIDSDFKEIQDIYDIIQSKVNKCSKVICDQLKATSIDIQKIIDFWLQLQQSLERFYKYCDINILCGMQKKKQNMFTSQDIDDVIKFQSNQKTQQMNEKIKEVQQLISQYHKFQLQTENKLNKPEVQNPQVIKYIQSEGLHNTNLKERQTVQAQFNYISQQQNEINQQKNALQPTLIFSPRNSMQFQSLQQAQKRKLTPNRIN